MFLAKKKVDLKLSLRKALVSVYGIGRARLNNLYQRLNYRYDVNLNKLSRLKRLCISQKVDRYTTDLALRKAEAHILLLHLQNGSYKGVRFRQGMPANGQRTHSNASTSRLKLTLAKLRLKK